LKIPNITITPPSSLTLSSNTPLENLKTGQQLYAKIVENIPSKNEVLLQIGNKLVRASSNATSTVGQTVLVQVERKTTEIILNVKQQTQSTNFINSVLRHTLPKQLPVQDFIAPLKELNRNINTSFSTALSTNPSLKSLNTLSNTIIQASPTVNSLSSESGIKSAIQNSGVFLERNIVQTITTPTQKSNNVVTDGVNKKSEQLLPNLNNQNLLITKMGNDLSKVTSIDLKANLVKLISVLKSWPGINSSNMALAKNIKNELIQATKPLSQQTNSSSQKLQLQVLDVLNKIEGAVAKITINQLANANPDTTVRQALQLEIPFYNGQTEEALFIKIQQDDASSKTNEIDNKWTVSLEMNPPNLGRIKNKLTLQGEHISSSFWAENQQTGNLLKSHLSILNERFKASSLVTKSLDVQTVIEPDLKKNTFISSSFSEKA
jgi:hypothetical protein